MAVTESTALGNIASSCCTVHSDRAESVTSHSLAYAVASASCVAQCESMSDACAPMTARSRISDTVNGAFCEVRRPYTVSTAVGVGMLMSCRCGITGRQRTLSAGCGCSSVAQNGWSMAGS